MTDLFERNRERRKEREQEALEADTARWDFMEKYKPILYPPAATLQGNWVIVLPNGGPQFEGSDPRAAIDAAIEKMKEFQEPK